MFDWNDEELANIIWGEAAEGDDHVVPYPGANKDYFEKKDQNREAAATKLTGPKNLGLKLGFDDAKLESSSNTDKDGGMSSGVSQDMDSWLDLPSSNFTKNNQDALTTGSSKASETASCDSAKGVSGTVQPDGDHQIFENPRDEAHNDFVNYGWENIGSFDDLDRIFSHDEPLFGHVLGDADEMWCSKDVTNSSLRSFSKPGDSPNLGSEALADASEILQVKAENERQDAESLNLVYGKLDDPPSLSFQHGGVPLEHGGDQIKTANKEQTNFSALGANGATSHLAANGSLTRSQYSDKVSRRKKHHKGQKKQEGKIEGRMSREFYGAWSSAGNSPRPYDIHHQLVPSVMQPFAPSAMSPLGQLPGLDSFHFQHMSDPYLYPPAYGNAPNPFTASHSVAHSPRSGKPKGQSVVTKVETSPGEINPINKRVGSSDKPPIMTPQEKIEKLRRRQQMQAMLAIQKQQEQFNSQASSYSIAQKGLVESQVQRLDGADVVLDDSSAPPSVNTSSALEWDDSNTISIAVADCAAEDVVLHRLQDVIGKLDSRARLCLRDSLCRLARSAVQRHYTSDTSSTNTCSKEDNEGPSEEDNRADNRQFRMPDVETETNPIDRAVAHLLFRRPPESLVKHPGTPDSPLSSKPPGESKTSSSMNLFKGSSQAEQGGSIQVPTSPKENQQVDLQRSSPCLDTSENTSNVGPGGDEAMDIEASK